MDRPITLRECALITALLIAGLCAQTLAADFQTGLQAYERGDYAAALREWRPLAELGDVDAQYALGFMYTSGEGVSHNDTEAAKWFRRAAEQNDAEAQYHLGRMYHWGKGVSQDDAEAVSWFRRATEQGHVDAQYSLGFMYANGKGVPKDFVKAAGWYRMAARQGHVAAQFYLGIGYALGRGVLEDHVEGYAWLSIALAQSSELETETRRQLIFKMSREQVATAKKLAREYWEQYVLPFRQ